MKEGVFVMMKVEIRKTAIYELLIKLGKKR
jgi:hypothetical protein